jgi:hypothetical protein
LCSLWTRDPVVVQENEGAAAVVQLEDGVKKPARDRLMVKFKGRTDSTGQNLFWSSPLNDKSVNRYLITGRDSRA